MYSGVLDMTMPKRTKDENTQEKKEIYMHYRNNDLVCPVKRSLYIQKRNALKKLVKEIKKDLYML